MGQGRNSGNDGGSIDSETVVFTTEGLRSSWYWRKGWMAMEVATAVMLLSLAQRLLLTHIATDSIHKLNTIKPASSVMMPTILTQPLSERQ